MESKIPDIELLLVCATAGECSDLVGPDQFFREKANPVFKDQKTILPQLFRNGNKALLLTGIGMVNTAMALGAVFARIKPAMAINFGISGVFPGAAEILEIVEVKEEVFAELGAENGDEFLDLQAMGFPNQMFEDGRLDYNMLTNPLHHDTALKSVRGITVNTVHGRQESIQEALARWEPEIESMEGAAFFHACLAAGVPFREYRCISNLVEERDRAAWKIREAVGSIQTFIQDRFLSNQ